MKGGHKKKKKTRVDVAFQDASQNTMSTEGLAENVELLRTRVMVEKDRVSSVSSSDFPGHYPGMDLAWNPETFKERLKVHINRLSESEMEFDLVGVDASIANAFRRILIAEVPTMAIEKVYIMNNTSIIQDEVLAHRLGMIPIKAHPTKFEFKDEESSPTDLNTIVFKLNVKCTSNPSASPDEKDPNVKYINSQVTSGHLVWVPAGEQGEKFKNDPIRPVHDDILIAKLRPGQELEMELHCAKGIGQDHAKFSPVATASYRLLPEIILKKEVTGDLAEKLKDCFPEGVISIVRENGVKKAKVLNPRKDTVSREVLRHKEFEDIVKLTRVRDHFIFNIEATGAISPQDLFRQAIKILIEKARIVRLALASVVMVDEQ